MKLTLIDFNNLETISEFDIVKGELKTSNSPFVHGNYSTCQSDSNQIIAIYGLKGDIYFRYGEKCWNICKEQLKFRSVAAPWTLKICRDFKVEDNDGVVLFSTRYVDRYWKNFKNFIDFTYDDFDRELDDIFLWLSRNCNDKNWRDEFSKKWSVGILIKRKKE